MNWKVPLANVSLEAEEIRAVTEVLRSGWLSMGPRTQQFEAEFAEFLGVKQALAVANGTAALHLACEAAGFAAGQEVLCPSLTFVASANAIRYTGAKPVFVDVESPDNLNMSVADAARKITPRTRGIMVVHYGGYPGAMKELNALARQYGLKVVEDCAHAPGAVYQTQEGAKKAGTLGNVGCFSFFSNKNMTTGEGGMVVTDDEELAAKLRIRRSHGMTTLTWDRHKGHSFSYDVVAAGYNYRLDEVRAALGSVQLQRLEAWNQRRGDLTQFYHKELSGLEQITLPFQQAPAGSTHHLYPILLQEGGKRPAFMQSLAEAGIQTSIHYPPVHLFSYYQELWGAGYDHLVPRTEDVAARLVTLPLFPTMSIEQIELVIESVRRLVR